jgi:hypothetical protein
VKVNVDVPDVPYPGSRTTQHFFRGAAEKLRNGIDAGGSNVRNTIAALLDRTAAAMDESVDVYVAPDGRSVIEELSYEERQSLPGEYHQPYWVDTATPKSWVCAVCWDEGVSHGWPCEPACRDGAAVARAGGLRRTL